MSNLPPTPSIPAPYVAGDVKVPANKVSGILELIWESLKLNCPGTSVEFRIKADPTNLAPVFIGQSNNGMPLSCTNYGAALTPMGEERVYCASYPGTGTPQSFIQLFSEAPAKIHVEVNT